MKQFYKLSLICSILLACSHQITSSADDRPNKRSRLTLDQDAHTNASSSKPRYHTRSVTRRHAEKLAQRDKKLAGQLAFYKKLEKKQDESATYKDLIQTFNYLDLPVDLQREVSEWWGADEPYRGDFWFNYIENQPVRIYHNCSLLETAIYENNGDEVQILLALHADINGTRNQRPDTPLYLAIEEYCFCSLNQKSNKSIKSYAIFKYLLQKGADCNKPNPDNNETPLIIAAKEIQTMPLFLDLVDMPNIDLQVTNENGLTVLDYIKENAMWEYSPVEKRKGCYRICAFLEKKGVASSVVLKPMPTDAVMHEQHWDVWYNPYV